MIWGVKNELKKLNKTLITIRDVQLDAEDQESKNHELTNWLKELKDVLYDVDDFLDEIQTHVQQSQRFVFYSHPLNFYFLDIEWVIS